MESATTEQARYCATDSDLPAIFWPDGQAPEEIQRSSSEEMKRYAAISLHYPALTKSDLEKQQARAECKAERERKRDAREARSEARSIYIKSAKRAQMAGWIFALSKQHAVNRMDSFERDFFLRTFTKFDRYFPFRLKWITQKQFDFARSLASRYLELPKE